MYRKILVPLDGSDLAERALEHAVPLARACGARLVLLRAVEYVAAVVGLPPIMASLDTASLHEAQQAQARDYLAVVVERLEGLGVDTEVVDGSPAEAIVEYAEGHGVDLIVISSHGRTGVARWVLGSVASRVLGHAPCPVMVVRG